MDKVVFAAAVKPAPEEDSTEQSRTFQVVRLSLRLRHVGWQGASWKGY